MTGIAGYAAVWLQQQQFDGKYCWCWPSACIIRFEYRIGYGQESRATYGALHKSFWSGLSSNLQNYAENLTLLVVVSKDADLLAAENS